MHYIHLFMGTLLLALTTAMPTTTKNFKTPAPLNEATTTHLNKRNIGGVRLSDGANFTMHVWYGIYPLNECIALHDYAGNLQSFRPDVGNECMIFQGECDANNNYAGITHTSAMIGDLSVFEPWIANVTSYMCFPEITVKQAKAAGRLKELFVKGEGAGVV